MISIDTNIVVRLLINDDKKQAAYAKLLFQKHRILITKTVLLETEWVLRFTYNLTRTAIYQAFENLFGLPQVTLEDPSCIIKTMQWYNDYQFDFADAMHLAASTTAEGFATLDKAFVKAAKKIPLKLLTPSNT